MNKHTHLLLHKLHYLLHKNNLYYNIAKYAFYRDSLINQDIFRLENDMYALFVSENVRKIVRKMKWEEFGFLEVDII